MSVVDKNIIISRIEQIDRHIGRLNSYKGISYERFKGDLTAQDVVEYNIFQIANHIIDIIQHIVVDEDYGLPRNSYQAAVMLFEKGVFDEADLQLFKRIIGFRNIIGHDYVRIDKNIVYSILTEKLNDIRSVISKITAKFI